MSIPLATYRIQFTKDFGFEAAAAIVPYLKQLGITHLYASPFTTARPGSTHGYDIVAHDRLNPELGGEDGFAVLSGALKSAGMELILDFVPNHMGVGFADNAWWLDVLEWGQKSPHANAFDIDWEGLPYRRQTGVLLPILGSAYGTVLQNGEIKLQYDAESGSFAAWYCEHKLPINPTRTSEIVRNVVTTAGAGDEDAGKRLLKIADRYRGRTVSYRDAPALKQSLAEVEGGAAVIERGLSAYRSNESEAGLAALHRLLERQNYHLAYWRVAFSAINYRRFFDINDLAGVRVEYATVFGALHTLAVRLVREGKLQGLRIDHIDGLLDPAQYTRRLSRLTKQGREPFYIVVEKILGEDEAMPALPGVAGTTGYEWLNAISSALLDAAALPALDRTWRDFTGERASFAEMLEAAKLRVLDTMLASEFAVLARSLARTAAGHFSTRDYMIDRLRAALQLYVLEFPVYRTYVTGDGPSNADRRLIEAVIARARARWHGPDPEIFDFLQSAITLDLAKDTGFSAPRVKKFALKLQQFTGPLMAKALEDTTFYRHHRLLAMNEVGGNPDAPPLTVEQFHARQRQRIKTFPHGMTATATHDTKRGEDARMRILGLAEMPDDWQAAVTGWHQQNQNHVQSAGNRRQPAVAHEYMIYQALIGAWPLTGVDGAFVERMKAYVVKAAREGKQETSWTNPNPGYEDALTGFVEKILDRNTSADFIASFDAFAKRTALLGSLNSLSQLVLKTLGPGVPDFYQGTELWDLSLVDPDNRRPVDFGLRQLALSEASAWPALATNWSSGRIKLALTHRLLQIRSGAKDLLQRGDYEPLTLEGPHAGRAIAFARTFKNRRLVVTVGRHYAALTDGGRQWPSGWDANVTQPPSDYEDMLAPGGEAVTGGLQLARLFRDLPVSVLQRR